MSLTKEEMIATLEAKGRISQWRSARYMSFSGIPIGLVMFAEFQKPSSEKESE